MSLLGILFLIIIVLFVTTIYLVIQGIKKKDIRKIVIPIIGFFLIIFMVYILLGTFVTSM